MTFHIEWFWHLEKYAMQIVDMDIMCIVHLQIMKNL